MAKTVGKGAKAKGVIRIANHEFRYDMPTHKANAYAKSAEEALRVTGKRLSALETARKAGDEATCVKLVGELLTTKKSKWAGVMHVAFQQDLKDRATLDDCVKCVQMLDLMKPIKEPARVYAMKKIGKEGWRPIAVFGLGHRTAQAMVKAVLERYFVPRSYQFTYLGVPKAIARFRELANAGNHFFANMDIASFFLEFQEESLKMALPLPTEVTGHAVVGRQMTWVAPDGKLSPFLHASCDELTDQARRGIPQGSSTSPIVAAIECSKLELSHGLETALINFADDFQTLHKTKHDAESAAGELQEAVGKLPGGNFSLKTKGIGHLSEGCVFLGHDVRLVDGAIRISPSDLNYTRLMSRLDAIQEACGVFSTGVIGEKLTPEQKRKVLQAIADSRLYLESWLAFFKECDDLDNSLVIACQKDIEMMMAKIGATPENLNGLTGSEVFSIEYSG